MRKAARVSSFRLEMHENRKKCYVTTLFGNSEGLAQAVTYSCAATAGRRKEAGLCRGTYTVIHGNVHTTQRSKASVRACYSCYQLTKEVILKQCLLAKLLLS